LEKIHCAFAKLRYKTLSSSQDFYGAAIAQWLSVRLPIGRLGVPQPLSELPYRSFGKSVHLNRPGKKHNSGFGLPPIAVTKNKIKKNKKNFYARMCLLL